MSVNAQISYIKKNINKKWLLENGFKYNKLLSDEETETYTYRFPVWKYNQFTALECELRIILGKEKVNINVYDYNTNDKYAPFYYCEYGNYNRMLKEIHSKIDGMLKRLQIIKYHNNRDKTIQTYSPGYSFEAGFYGKNERTTNTGTETIKIRYLSDKIEKLTYTDGKPDWIDLRAAEEIMMQKGEFKLIPLGVAMKLPKGYEAHIVPCSLTFKNFGIIQANHQGIVDCSYCGDNDQWFMAAYALRDTQIHVNDRICRFRIMENQPKIAFEEVESLGNGDIEDAAIWKDKI